MPKFELFPREVSDVALPEEPLFLLKPGALPRHISGSKIASAAQRAEKAVAGSEQTEVETETNLTNVVKRNVEADREGWIEQGQIGRGSQPVEIARPPRDSGFISGLGLAIREKTREAKPINVKSGKGKIGKGRKAKNTRSDVSTEGRKQDEDFLAKVKVSIQGDTESAADLIKDNPAFTVEPQQCGEMFGDVEGTTTVSRVESERPISGVDSARPGSERPVTASDVYLPDVNV